MQEDKFHRQNPLGPAAPADEYSQLLARVDELLTEEEADLALEPANKPEPSVEQILDKMRQYSKEEGARPDFYEKSVRPPDPGGEISPPEETVDEILAQVRQESLLPYEAFYQDFEKILESNSDTPVETAGETDFQPQKPEARSKWKSWLAEIAFYAVLIGVVVGVASLKGGAESQGPKSVAGLSAFTVLSSSMESVIPKGSLVVTIRTDPKKLKIGDDVTYLASQSTTITHRIVGIIENYEDTGQRAFETKGVDNQSPDSRPVPAVNVVGKVIFHSYLVGKAASFVGEHWVVILLLAFLLFGFAKTLKGAFGKPKKPKGEKQ